MVTSNDTGLTNPVQQLVSGQHNQVIHHVSGGTVVYVEGDYIDNHKAPSFPEPTLKSLPLSLLPRAFPQLLGRCQEIETTIATLPSGFPVEFHGDLGIGKTALLRHIAHHPSLVQSFAAGLIYLRQRNYQSIDDLLQVLYETFYKSSVSQKLRENDIREALAPLKALILLDESALSPKDIEHLVVYYPNLTFLFISSSQALSGEGKSLYLKGLSVEDSTTLIARELGCALASEEKKAAENLAIALQGNPLQLIQAAARAKEEAISLATVAKQIKRSKDKQDFLKEPEKIILILLSLLAGLSLAAEHIASITNIPNISLFLDRLQRLNLLSVEHGNYHILGDFGFSKKALTAWQGKITEHFTQWIQAGFEPSQLLERAEVLFQCLGWEATAGNWANVITLGQPLEKLFALNGQWGAWAKVLHWLLPAARAIGDRALEGYVLHQLGSRAFCLNELTEAQKYLTQARDIRAAIQDPSLAATEHNLANLNLPLVSPAPDIPSPAKFPWFKLALISGCSALFVGFGIGLWLFSIPKSTPPDNTDSLTDISEELGTVTDSFCTSINVSGLSETSGIQLELESKELKLGDRLSGTITLSNCVLPEDGILITAQLISGDHEVILETFTLSNQLQQNNFLGLVPKDFPIGKAEIILLHGTSSILSKEIEISDTMATQNCPEQSSDMTFIGLPNNVERGGILQGKIQLDCVNQKEDVVLQISGYPKSLGNVPNSVTIRANNQEADLPEIIIPTSDNFYPDGISFQITATHKQFSRSSSAITISAKEQDQDQKDNPLAKCPNEDTKLTISQLPRETTWGQTETGAIELNNCVAPQGGLKIQISDNSQTLENKSQLASLNTSVEIPEGKSSTKFTFRTITNGAQYYPNDTEVNLEVKVQNKTKPVTINIPAPVAQCPDKNTELEISIFDTQKNQTTKAAWGETLEGEIQLTNCTAPEGGLTVILYVSNTEVVEQLEKSQELPILEGETNTKFKFKTIKDGSNYQNEFDLTLGFELQDTNIKNTKNISISDGSGSTLFPLNTNIPYIIERPFINPSLIVPPHDSEDDSTAPI